MSTMFQLSIQKHFEEERSKNPEFTWENCVMYYNKRYTLTEIGAIYNVSRQRVWQRIKPHQDKVTIKRTNHNQSTKPNVAEKHIQEQFDKRGFVYEKMPVTYAYDFIVNGKKIEIKHRSKKDLGTNLYHFTFILQNKEKIDYYIFIVGELEKEPHYFIFPARVMKNFLSIPYMYQSKTKYSIYYSAWDQLK